MNLVFFLLVAVSVAVAASGELGSAPGAMAALSKAMLQAAEGAVPLALGLVGVMALFLGLMKVAEAGGLLTATARLLSPLLARLFPEVPPGHPAMGAMVMNVSANLLGLGNAATPFGIRAMEELESLNPRPGTATDAQVLFLAINTAGVTVLPTSVIALRAASGAANPAAVVAPTLFATAVSAVAAVVAARLLQRVMPGPHGIKPPVAAPLSAEPAWKAYGVLFILLALIPLTAIYGTTLGPWIVPLLALGLLGFGMMRRVPVYESFVEGAKEGFTVGVRIIPYLVAILVAVAMLRSSGAMDMALQPLGRLTAPLGLGPEALAMAGMRSLSGSGSFGLLAEAMKNPALGPDGYAGILLGTIYGSTETTFYVLAVYFGAVGIRRTRHAVAVGLIADAAALIAAVLACRVMFG